MQRQRGYRDGVIVQMAQIAREGLVFVSGCRFVVPLFFSLLVAATCDELLRPFVANAHLRLFPQFVAPEELDAGFLIVLAGLITTVVSPIFIVGAVRGGPVAKVVGIGIVRPRAPRSALARVDYRPWVGRNRGNVTSFVTST